ncbi:putative mitochondrial protein, partial [Mucuna pruriens]
MFLKVEINIPFLDAIKQIPKYVKFLKELCVHKRKKMNGMSALTKNEEVTVGAQALLKKCRDPEIFSIPCTISECTFANAMLDLGASINVMPTSIYKALNFGDLELTRMTIQLANRSVVQPLGILEDVLVQVNELIFLADFYNTDAKPRLIRWMLLLQEFNLEIRDKKGAENSVADHLSRIEKESELMPIRDEFPDEHLLHIKTSPPWFADICNFVAASRFPPEASRAYKDKLRSDAKYYIWDDPYLWRLCSDKVIRRCIPEAEFNSVLQFCHSAPGGGHYGSTRTARKVLDCGLYWPTIFRDAHEFVSTCENCQKAGVAMNRRHEMPQQPIQFCEIFDVWGIDFMGPFPVSNGYSYILLAVDYVSRWVEAIATRTNDARVVVDFLKSNIFCRFGVPKALISDQGTYHLPVELEHRAYWAVKQCNLAYDQAGEQRKFQLQELDELRLEAYENSRIYKQKIKRFHDQQILRKEFRVGQKVLLFNSRLKLIAGKLRSRWDGPFVITNVFPHGAVQLKDEHSNSTFQVNGHQIKPFHEGPAPITHDMEIISLMEPASPDDPASH